MRHRLISPATLSTFTVGLVLSLLLRPLATTLVFCLRSTMALAAESSTKPVEVIVVVGPFQVAGGWFSQLTVASFQAASTRPAATSTEPLALVMLMCIEAESITASSGIDARSQLPSSCSSGSRGQA